jgi:hypothetical protein
VNRAFANYPSFAVGGDRHERSTRLCLIRANPLRSRYSAPPLRASASFSAAARTPDRGLRPHGTTSLSPVAKGRHESRAANRFGIVFGVEGGHWVGIRLSTRARWAWTSPPPASSGIRCYHCANRRSSRGAPHRALTTRGTEWSEMDLDDLANIWRSSPPGQFLPFFASSFFSRLATPVAPRSRA